MPNGRRTWKEASRYPSTAGLLMWALLSGCLHNESIAPRLAPECKAPGPTGPDTIPCRVSPDWVRQQAAPPVHPLIQAAFSEEATALWPKTPLASVEESLTDSHRVLLPSGHLAMVEGRTQGGEILSFFDGDLDGDVDHVEELILASDRSTVRIAHDMDRDGRPDQRELRVSFDGANMPQSRMATLDERYHIAPGISGWSVDGHAWLQSNWEN
jgi:hypothetical protein